MVFDDLTFWISHGLLPTKEHKQEEREMFLVDD